MKSNQVQSKKIDNHLCQPQQKLQAEELKTHIFNSLVIGRSKRQSPDYVTHEIFLSVQNNIELAREMNLPLEYSQIKNQLVDPWLNQSQSKTSNSLDPNEEFWKCMDNQNIFFKTLNCVASGGVAVSTRGILGTTAAVGTCGDLIDSAVQCFDENINEQSQAKLK